MRRLSRRTPDEIQHVQIVQQQQQQHGLKQKQLQVVTQESTFRLLLSDEVNYQFSTDGTSVISKKTCV